METVSFTIIKAQNIVSKTLLLNKQGDLETKEGGAMSHGTSFTYETNSLHDLVGYMKATNDGHHYMCLGTSQYERANVTVSDLIDSSSVVDDENDNLEPEIARSKDFFSFQQKPGFLLVDYDPKPEAPKTYTPAELLDLMYEAEPKLRDTPHLWKTSSSSCISNGDETLRGIKGQHILFALKDARDIPRVASALFTRLWLNGHGFIGLTASGAMKKYTAMDGIVNSPERPVFLSANTIEPLSQNVGYVVINPEAPCLDSRKYVLELSFEEEKQYRDLWKSKKSEITLKKKAYKLKQDSIQRTAKRTGLSVSDVTQMLESDHLYGDFELLIRTGDKVKVSELFNDIKKYQGIRCADPFDPEAYNGKLDIAWINVEAQPPYIWSHAHGGKRYILHKQVQIDTEISRKAAYARESYDDDDTRDIQIAKYSLAELASALIKINHETYAKDVAGALWDLDDPNGYALFRDWLFSRGMKDTLVVQQHWAEGRTQKQSYKLIFKKARENHWNGIESDYASELVRKYVRLETSVKLKILTDTYASTLQEGKHYVIYKQFKASLERWDTVFAGIQEIKQFHRSDMVYTITVKKNGEESLEKKEIMNLWDSSSDKRQYGQVVFEPEGGVISGRSEKRNISVNNTGANHSYNLYQGLAVIPAKDGSTVIKYGHRENIRIKSKGCELMKKHIREVWCDNNDELYEYILNWFARLFQNPDETGGTALVLRSGEGSGKNAIAEPMIQAFGSHGVIVTDSNDFLGRFNSSIAKSCLVVLNEAIWGGSAKSQQGKLKALITDKNLRFEEKFVKADQIKNCTHLIIMTNAEWAVPMGFGDRRFVALDVSMKRAKDFEYFKALNHEIDMGGIENFVYFLLNRNINGYNMREIPQYHSNLRVDTKFETGDAVESWWYDCLARDELYGSAMSRPLGDYTYTVTEITDSYVAWCTEMGHNRRIQTRKATKFLRFSILVPNRSAKEGFTEYDGRDGNVRTLRLPPRDKLLEKSSVYFGEDISLHV